jgi:hypothetical protein
MYGNKMSLLLLRSSRESTQPDSAGTGSPFSLFFIQVLVCQINVHYFRQVNFNVEVQLVEARNSENCRNSDPIFVSWMIIISFIVLPLLITVNALTYPIACSPPIGKRVYCLISIYMGKQDSESSEPSPGSI